MTRMGPALTPLSPLSALRVTSSLSSRAERGEVISKGMGAPCAPIPFERISSLPLPSSFTGTASHCRGRVGWGWIRDLAQTTRRQGRLWRYT
jgi:hypothetical protein